MEMTAGITESPATGIGKLLNESRFVVPSHQRDYSWTEDQVDQLADRKNMGIYQQFCRFYLPNGIHFAQDVEHSHRADLVLQQHPLLLHGR
jgi:hypothetical protein